MQMNRFVGKERKIRLYFIKFKSSSASSAFWFLALYPKDKTRNLISQKRNSASSASSALWTWPISECELRNGKIKAHFHFIRISDFATDRQSPNSNRPPPPISIHTSMTFGRSLVVKSTNEIT